MMTLAERLARAKEMPRHLSELSCLTGHKVERFDLLSPERTSSIRDQVRLTPPSPSVAWETGFREKETPRFRKFLERLHSSNASDVYLWTPATNICGLLPPLPRRAVNFDFPFNLNPEGILTVLTSDLQDRLILDYSEAKEGARLEIEAAGPHWSTVEF